MRRALLSLFLIVCLTGFGIYIADVRFTGLKHLSEQEIFENVGKLFGELTSSEIEDYLRRVFALGYFSSLKPTLVSGEMGYILEIEVEENPLVSDWKVEVEGIKLVKLEDLEKAVKLERKKPLNLIKLRESVEAIRNEYQKNGYFLVEISGELENDVYKITVKEYALWDVVFNGEIEGLDIASLVSKSKLKLLRDYYSSSPIVRFFTMNKKDFYPTLSDVQRFLDTLRSLPYFGEETSIDFVKTTVRDIEERNVMILVVRVVQRRIFEGERKINVITFSGNTIFSQEQLLKACGLRTGESVRNVDVLLAMNRVVEFYEKNNYPYVWVKAKLEGDVLNFEVFEKYVKSVEVKGLEKTRPYVVKNLIAVEEGEPLNKEKIALTYSYLMNSMYFDKVNIQPRLNLEETDVDLTIELKEAEKTRNFMGTLGWSMPKTGEEWWKGFVGFLQLSMVNNFGYGENLYLNVNLGFSERKASVGVSVPLPTDIPVKLETEAGYRKIVSTDTDSVSLKSMITTLPYKGNSFGIGLAYEKILGETNTGTLSFLGRYTFNDRNSAILPTEGRYLRLDVQKAGLLYFKEQSYWKTIVVGELYYPIFESLYAKFGGLGGVVLNELGEEKLEVSGTQGIRGYGYLETERIFKFSADLNWILQSENIPVVFGVFADFGGAKKESGFEYLSSIGPKLNLVIPFLGNVEVGYAYLFRDGKWNFYFNITNVGF